MAGMFWFEYRDLAWAMTQFALDNPEREQRAAMARHNAALSCYRWAMVAALPMGGPDFVQLDAENAQEHERTPIPRMSRSTCGITRSMRRDTGGTEWLTQGHRPVRIDAVECTHAVGSQPTVPDGATER